MPASELEARLAALAADPHLAPLVQAQAWWHLRSAARGRMDGESAREAERALGLLDGWVGRAGPAPHPTEALSPAGWTAVPGPVLWLEAALRPAQRTQGTVATRLRHPTGGPAVLRLGYDDTAKVRLNGDEVFTGDVAHDLWLDQATIPVVLRPGDNTLVVQVGQVDGAWRLVARITDGAGRPLTELTAHPDPWGPVPAPAEVPEGDDPSPRDLWAELAQAADAEPPVAQDLRDLADFARVSGLPDRELAVPRVAIEGAWEVDPSPQTLRAWLEVLPDAERAALRTGKRAQRPVTEADAYADRHLLLADGWGHYYGRRHAETRAVLQTLLGEDPAWPPARRLEAVFLEDLGLPHRAAARLADAQEARPDRVRLAQARIHALRSGGRITEALASLHALVEADLAGPDLRYELADLRARRGETQEAVALLDEVIVAHPERVTYALEAAAILTRAGDDGAATARLEALHRRLPQDPVVAEALARRYQAQGRLTEALPLVQQALEAQPGDDGLLAWVEALSARPEAPALGPPVAELTAAKAPKDAVAHVLYHHAQAAVGEDGRAVRRVRRLVRILTDEGARRYNTWSLPYVPGQQRLTVETARLIREGAPDASPQRRDEDLSEPDYRLYYDLRAQILAFDRPQPGDLIEVAWALADTAPDPSFPGYFGELAYLQEAAPRARVVVEVTGPRAAAMHLEVHAPGLAVQREGQRVTAQDVPAIALEPNMPGASSLQAYVHVSTEPGWDAVQARYQALLGERTTPTPALEAVAREWAGDAQGPEAILAALYAKVADRTRYVGLEFGVRSFQPAAPSETLARGFGDCKDKAT
ncbi:MAG: DUF3857 domain-containing protein, partial [Myxococcales bacterium]|nr:DUF3857 domain-containing protein [Myxococcales bacterium]